MDIELIRQKAAPGDLILIGSNSILSKLIGYGQKIQTSDGKPSKWSHVMMYVSRDCVAESTIDFKPYQSTGNRLDNGPQYNYLSDHAGAPVAMLMLFPWNSRQRERLVDRADALISAGMTYPIIGLVGSLLGYWVFKWKSNPLQSKRSVYCSAFIQEIYTVLQVDFDIYHTARQTSPEIISQYDYPGLIKIPV